MKNPSPDWSGTPQAVTRGFTDQILAAAGALELADLRTLDAINRAGAASFGTTLQHVIT